MQIHTWNNGVVWEIPPFSPSARSMGYLESSGNSGSLQFPIRNSAQTNEWNDYQAYSSAMQKAHTEPGVIFTESTCLYWNCIHCPENTQRGFSLSTQQEIKARTGHRETEAAQAWRGVWVSSADRGLHDGYAELNLLRGIWVQISRFRQVVKPLWFFSLRLFKEHCFRTCPQWNSLSSIPEEENHRNLDIIWCWSVKLFWLYFTLSRKIPWTPPLPFFLPLEKELSYRNEVKIKANLMRDCYIFALTIGYGWLKWATREKD